MLLGLKLEAPSTPLSQSPPAGSDGHGRSIGQHGEPGIKRRRPDPDVADLVDDEGAEVVGVGGLLMFPIPTSPTVRSSL
jgi:hypothetical protein